MTDLPAHVLLLITVYSATNILIFLTTLYFTTQWPSSYRKLLLRAAAIGMFVMLGQLGLGVVTAVYGDPNTIPAPSSGLAGLFCVGMVGFVVVTIETAQTQTMGRSSAIPLLFGGRDRFSGVVPAIAAGVAAMAISVTGLWAIGFQVVREGFELFPETSAPAWLYVSSFSLAVVASAFSEEIAFRGLLQPWLKAALGGGRAEALIATVVTSALWACGHAAYTDPAWIKIGQIFAIGLAFGYLSQRYNLQSAILAHATLNASSLLTLPLLSP